MKCIKYSFSFIIFNLARFSKNNFEILLCSLKSETSFHLRSLFL